MLKPVLFSMALMTLAVTALPQNAAACGPYGGGRAFSHHGGAFVDAGGGAWQELDAGGRVVFSFRESSRDQNGFVLFDASRSLSLYLPRNGGQSYWASAANGSSWNPLYAETATTTTALQADRQRADSREWRRQGHGGRRHARQHRDDRMQDQHDQQASW